MNSYPSQPIDAIWKSGDPLDFAWFGKAHENLRDQYREAIGEGATKTLRLLMEADVRQKLASRSLIAIGYRTQPDLGTQPEIIPAFMFESQSVIINWDNSEITGLGRSFESVTVTKFTATTNEDQPTIPTSLAKKRRGPKGYGDVLAEAVAALEVQEEHFADWTREKQVLAIQNEAAAGHPGRFKGGKPGRSTVYRYLDENPI